MALNSYLSLTGKKQRLIWAASLRAAPSKSKPAAAKAAARITRRKPERVA